MRYCIAVDNEAFHCYRVVVVDVRLFCLYRVEEGTVLQLDANLRNQPTGIGKEGPDLKPYRTCRNGFLLHCR